MMEEPRVVRVWWEMPLGSRRSVDVRQRMRKRPVERKSAVVSNYTFRDAWLLCRQHTIL